MSKIVEVPGVGNVEFPDSMGDDEIGKALKAHAAPPAPAPARVGMGDVQAARSAEPFDPDAQLRAASKDANIGGIVGSMVLPPQKSPLGAMLGYLVGKGYGKVAPEFGGLYQPPASATTQPNGLPSVAPSANDAERYMPALAIGMAGPTGPTASRAVALEAKPLTAVADKLDEIAGNRNIKAAGAIQSDVTRARKQVGRERLNELGQDMGKEGLVGPTSTPAKTYERAGALMDKAGQDMGEILTRADQAPGAALNNVDLLKRVGREVLGPMTQDPHQAAAAEKFTKLIGKYADIYGNRDLTASELHTIRRNISRDLYGWRGNKDPEADAIKSALHDFRGVVSDELAQSVDRAGLSTPEWQAANRRFEVGARAEEFADKGMDRAHGNNLVSPMEALAGMTAMAGGTAAGHAGAGLTAAGATVAAALARRHGSGTIGYGAQKLAAALRPSASGEAVAPERLAFMEWLRSRVKGPGPTTAAADEEKR